MIISAIREIVNPKVNQIAKCGSLASTMLKALDDDACVWTTDRQFVRSNR